MAFDIKNLNLMSGSTGNLALWTYKTTDLVADVFNVPNYFQEAQELYGMKRGDFVYIITGDNATWGFMNNANTLKGVYLYYP